MPAARARTSAPTAARRRAGRGGGRSAAARSATMEASVTSSPSPRAPLRFAGPQSHGGAPQGQFAGSGASRGPSINCFASVAPFTQPSPRPRRITCQTEVSLAARRDGGHGLEGRGDTVGATRPRRRGGRVAVLFARRLRGAGHRRAGRGRPPSARAVHRVPDRRRDDPDGRGARGEARFSALVCVRVFAAAPFLALAAGLGWATLSVLWTPYPISALQHALKLILLILATLLAVAAPRENARATDLYLFPIGVVARHDRHGGQGPGRRGRPSPRRRRRSRPARSRSRCCCFRRSAA